MAHDSDSPDYVLKYRVTQGAELLDQKVAGWADRVNLEKLNTRHGSVCVLGQVYGNFGYGLSDTLGNVAYRDGHLYGFAGGNAEYPALTLFWKDAVRDRLGVIERPWEED